MCVKPQIKSILINGLIFTVITLIIIGLLYHPISIGLADNSDFSRTINNFGIQPEKEQKYFSYQDHYVIKEPKSILAYGIDIFKPLKYSPEKYYSSQYLFVKCSLFINSIYNKLTNTDRHSYFIGFQTILYILCYALAITFFLSKKWLPSIISEIILKACFIVVFLDSGYLVYFNSFFGEATTLIFLIMAFVLLLFLEKRQAKSVIIYCCIIVSIGFFSSSKSANFPSAVLMSIPLIYSIIKLEGKKKKIALLLLIVTMLYIAYGYVKKVPELIEKVTTYQATFYGVLKDNPESEKVIEELGLEEELIQLESTHGYLPISYDIYGDEFNTLFFKHVNKFDILKYYINHPDYFMKKLDISAEAALPLRPTYLSNLLFSQGKGDLVFSFRFNFWEKLRKSFSGKALFVITGIIIISFINVVWLFLKKGSAYKILLRLVLVGSTVGQFIVPIISNGEADLMKHMFLFNVNLDLLIIILLIDNLGLLVKNYKKSIPVFLIIVILMVHPFSRLPKTIFLGKINEKPIKWYVIEEKGEWLKVISKDALFTYEFDDTSNFFKGSKLEKVLINKKLEWFTKEEQGLIGKEKYPLILNYDRVNEAIIGDRPYYWFSSMKYAKQNSDRAYQTELEWEITLPSIADVKQLYNISKQAAVLNEAYWLRTPYYSSLNFNRIVAPDYQVYHKLVTNDLGVRPMMWIRKE